ncbi:MAG: PIN domain-containing protein [Betaproteobacteria bacterium]|nr:PIN domain-containing protein [Betaproteobacteria bacterium]MBI2961894.1 PIN domain-containing protein [Betaproteobacteria bacterium]
MNYMFDTNAISALVHQRRGWERLARRIDGLEPERRLISAITLSELQTMIAKAAAPESKGMRIWRVLLNFHLVDFGEIAALYTGSIRAYLEPRGLKIGPMDALLAAHASSIGATVVTANTRELSRVPGLAVQDWGC